MKIIKRFLTKNPCYKIGRKMKIKGIMLHSVGCPVERAENFISSWDNSHTNVCVHAFVEANGDIYQTLPWDTYSWHCGKGKLGSANDGYISVEMCEPSCIIYSSRGIVDITDEKYARDFCTKTYHHACVLFASLCIKYSITPDNNTIISHSEGYKKGIASNHGDVEHLWRFFGLNMDKFRADVLSIMKDLKNTKDEKNGKQITATYMAKLISINDIDYPCDVIVYQGHNFIKIRSLSQAGMDIFYNPSTKIPSIRY